MGCCVNFLLRKRNLKQLLLRNVNYVFVKEERCMIDNTGVYIGENYPN